MCQNVACMKKSRLLKIMIILLVLTVPAVYLLRLSIFPGYFIRRADAAYGYAEQRVEFTAADGTTLRGWLFNRGEDKPLTVLYTGNNMNIGSVLSLAAEDTQRSYLMLNYRGYGDSEGVPSETKLVDDARYAIEEARRRLGSQSAPLHIAGYSIGSGVATQVAAAVHPATLTLICPFDCITDVACDFVPVLPRLIMPATFDSAHYAGQIRCPVTIIRATHDTLVTPPHTAKLMAAFSTPPTEHVLPADHNTIFTHPDFAHLLRRSFEQSHPLQQAAQ